METMTSTSGPTQGRVPPAWSGSSTTRVRRRRSVSVAATAREGYGRVWGGMGRSVQPPLVAVDSKGPLTSNKRT